MGLFNNIFGKKKSVEKRYTCPCQDRCAIAKLCDDVSSGNHHATMSYTYDKNVAPTGKVVINGKEYEVCLCNIETAATISHGYHEKFKRVQNQYLTHFFTLMEV